MRLLKGLKYWLVGMFLVFLMSGTYPYFNFKSSEATPVLVQEGVLGGRNSVFTFNLIPESNSLLWRERSRAFQYRDRLYDVVKSEMVNGKLVLNCVDDAKRNQVFKGLNGVMACCESDDQQVCDKTGLSCDNLSTYTADTVFVFVICPDGDGMCFDHKEVKCIEGISTVPGSIQCN